MALCVAARNPPLMSPLKLTVMFVFAAGLPPLLHGLLQHLQHPHTVSVAALLGYCHATEH